MESYLADLAPQENLDTSQDPRAQYYNTNLIITTFQHFSTDKLNEENARVISQVQQTTKSVIKIWAPECAFISFMVPNLS